MTAAKYLGYLFVGLAILLFPLTGHSRTGEDSTAPEPVAVEIIDPTERGAMSYADAAATALAAQDDHTLLHYKEITAKAIAAGWFAPKAKKPELSLYAATSNEIKRHWERGEPPRFFRAGRGYFDLAAWQPKGIRKEVKEVEEVEEHNRAVHVELLSRIKAMPPDKFEELVGDLLVGMGLDEVEVTSYGGDGGIDVRGVLPFGGVANINVAVQVKRYSANVQWPEIQKLRGSLDEHDCGFFITTNDFSSGAKEEAERTGGGKPTVLVNGRQVVNLLMEHGIGVTRSALDVYELDAPASVFEPAATEP